MEARRRPDASHIIQTNAILNGLTPEVVTGKDLNHFVVAVRDEISAQLAESGFRQTEIARMLGKGCSSSVSTGIRRALSRRFVVDGAPRPSDVPTVYLPIAHLGGPEVNFEAIVEQRKKRELRKEKARQNKEKILQAREKRRQEAIVNEAFVMVTIPIVAEHYGVEPEAIISEKRPKVLVHPRQAILYILSKETTLSMKQIAELVGKSDHTVVLHAIERTEAHLANDEHFQKRMDKLIEEIRQAASS